MIIHLILAVLSIATSGLTCYFTHALEHGWYFIFIFIAALPILHILWFGIYVSLLYIASLFIKKDNVVEKPNRVAYWFVRQTCLEVLFFFRARVKFSGPEFPEERCLFIHNHTSNFDPMPFIYYCKNQPLSCISKPENMNLPIAGKFIYQAGFIPINREDDFEAAKSIAKAANFIKKDIASVYVCPEGTRNHHPENGMLDWKPGCLKVATRSKCPIVVCALSNAYKIHKNFWYKHTNLYVDVCEIIPYEKYKDMNTVELAHYCRDLIAAKLKERS